MNSEDPAIALEAGTSKFLAQQSALAIVEIACVRVILVYQ